jgi:hypothetical protein
MFRVSRYFAERSCDLLVRHVDQRSAAQFWLKQPRSRLSAIYRGDPALLNVRTDRRTLFSIPCKINKVLGYETQV